MKIASLIVLVLVTLVACGPAAAPEETSVAPAEAPAPTALPSSEMVSPAPTATSPAVMSPLSPLSPLPKPTETGGRQAEFPNTIVVYRLDSQEWTIYATGRIVGGEGMAWTVPVESVTPVFDAVEAEAFWDLEEVYGSAEGCPACPVQTLTVYRGGEVKAVTVRQEPETLPKPLATALEAIEGVIVLE